MPQVAEHRFHRGKPSAISGFAFIAVDGPLHPVGVAFFRAIGFAAKEGDLADLRLLRRAQAFVSLITGHTVA